MYNNRAVKKLTIPEWLNESATAMAINFSQSLQEALIQKINVHKNLKKKAPVLPSHKLIT